MFVFEDQNEVEDTRLRFVVLLFSFLVQYLNFFFLFLLCNIQFNFLIW